jgi:hypothetical protein
MTKTVWEVARLSGVSGVHTTWTVDTTKISQRVRNNAIRMMRSGVVVGWGNAAKLCHALCRHYGAKPVVMYSGSYGKSVGLTVDVDTFKPESLPIIRERVRAGITGELLTEDKSYRVASLKSDLEDVSKIGVEETWVRFRNISRPELLALLAKHINPQKLVRTSRVADELEKDQRILIDQIQC